VVRGKAAGGKIPSESPPEIGVDPESLTMCFWTHAKVDRFRTKDSVGETPTDATETVALPKKTKDWGVEAEEGFHLSSFHFMV
jgi:hypothetical protein